MEQPRALDQEERDQLAAQVLAEVERLLSAGKSGRVEVNVHPTSRRKVGRPVTFVHERPAE